jgi:hypothetical protein
MRKIFLDTVGIIALVNKRDSLHEHAVQINSQLLLEKVTFHITDYILVEVGNALAKNKMLAIKTLDNLRNSEDIQSFNMTKEILEEAIGLYKKYADKEWGLTDVSSFVVMKKLKIEEAFTSDIHFKQYGFKILLEK